LAELGSPENIERLTPVLYAMHRRSPFEGMAGRPAGALSPGLLYFLRFRSFKKSRIAFLRKFVGGLSFVEGGAFEILDEVRLHVDQKLTPSVISRTSG
jgi:hypothetical protein